MDREIFSCSLLLVILMDLLLAPCNQAAPASSRALRAAAAQNVHIEYNPEADMSLSDLVLGEAKSLTRKRRHAESEASSNLDLAEDRELLSELQEEHERARSRRSTVFLALTMAIRRCEHVPWKCNVEYKEGNKKVRLRISDM